MGETKTVAVIGAGPVGLAAAAHLLERGLTPIVLEEGAEIGHAVRQWGHVQLFSPWEYNVDRAAERLLAKTGWNSPDPAQYPTGAELLERYLEPLALNTELAPHIRTSSRVTDISRIGYDKLKTKGRESAPFEIRYRNGEDWKSDWQEVGRPKSIRADSVIDTSGTWQSPNPAGANGLPAIGEKEAGTRVVYAMPDVLGKDRARYAGKTTAVLGAGHSAIGTLTDLARLKAQAPGTEVIWLLRGNNPAKAFGGGANDKLAARGELGAAFAGLVAAGQVFVRELRIQLDPAIECPVALAPLIDPNEHSCGTVRPHGARELAQAEPGFYFAGMKSYGRAPTFLMITGYEQVRSIAADIAGDREAAERVELVLPETGVCNRSASPGLSECCGGPAPAETSACCADDATAKQQGKSGCGCSGILK